MIKIAPLKGSLMVAGIIGFLISSMIIYDKYPKWGFSFSLLFVLMFVASLISMTYAPLPEDRK